MITIRESTRGDFDELVAGMRQKDELEVLLTGMSCSSRALYARAGNSLTALDDTNRVICIFGCTPLSGADGYAAPWMLGTHRLDKHLFKMCKLARRYVEEWLEQYPVLTNATLSTNDTVIAWLKWLGFTFSYTFPAPADQSQTFIQFTMRRSCVTPSPSQLLH